MVNNIMIFVVCSMSTIAFGQVDYNSDIQSIFNSNCIDCHGNSAGLDLSSYSNLITGNVLISENSAESLIIQKLRGTASGAQMPKNSAALSESTINLIATWIDEGALEEPLDN